MNKSIMIAAVFVLLTLGSCNYRCLPVSGPNNIAYSLISNPGCYSDYAGYMEGAGMIINTPADFDVLCPGETPPASWNLADKTYIVVTAGHTASAPYLAGVGKNPQNHGEILVTIGLPCNYGMVPAVMIYKTFTLEIAKTTDSLKVDVKNESR